MRTSIGVVLLSLAVVSAPAALALRAAEPREQAAFSSIPLRWVKAEHPNLAVTALRSARVSTNDGRYGALDVRTATGRIVVAFRRPDQAVGRGELEPPLADAGVVLLRQALDEVVDVGGLGGGDDFLAAGGGSAAVRRRRRSGPSWQAAVGADSHAQRRAGTHTAAATELLPARSRLRRRTRRRRAPQARRTVAPRRVTPSAGETSSAVPARRRTTSVR